MKAVVDVVGASTTAGVQSGRIARRRDVENEEIQMYLSKLKDLVPFMPKNKRLTKLEVIQYVIDYICDLQYALETHPSAEVAARLQGEAGPAGTAGPQRQPLGQLTFSPNTIVPGCSTSMAMPTSPVMPDLTPAPSMSPVPLDKVQEVDTRPISC